MNKKISLLCILLCVSLCACQGTVPEKESVPEETEQSVLQKDILAEPDMMFMEKYNEVFVEMNARRTALIYLDDDSVPDI